MSLMDPEREEGAEVLGEEGDDPLVSSGCTGHRSLFGGTVTVTDTSERANYSGRDIKAREEEMS